MRRTKPVADMRDIEKQTELLNQTPRHQQTTESEERRFLKNHTLVELQRTIAKRRADYYGAKTMHNLRRWNSAVLETKRFLELRVKFNRDLSLSKQDNEAAKLLTAELTIITIENTNITPIGRHAAAAAPAAPPAHVAHLEKKSSPISPIDTRAVGAIPLAEAPPPAPATPTEPSDITIAREAITQASTTSALTTIIIKRRTGADTSRLKELKDNAPAAAISEPQPVAGAVSPVTSPLAAADDASKKSASPPSTSSNESALATNIGSPSTGPVTMPLANVAGAADLTSPADLRRPPVLPADLVGSDSNLQALDTTPRPAISAAIPIGAAISETSTAPAGTSSPATPPPTSADAPLLPAASNSDSAASTTDAPTAEKKSRWFNLFSCGGCNCSSKEKKATSNMEALRTAPLGQQM